MKPQIHQFNQSINVIQVFSNINIYDKEVKSKEDRKDALLWQSIVSKNAYLLDNVLVFNEIALILPSFKNCDTIIIDDSVQGSSQIHCFSTFQKFNFHCFEIYQKEEQSECWFNGNSKINHAPKRQSFKLFDFPPTRTVEVKVNSKTDMRSISSLGKRQFIEEHFIFQHLGIFESCLIAFNPTQTVLKEIPAIEKTIDLIKPLW
jgi:hypothetical protein